MDDDGTGSDGRGADCSTHDGSDADGTAPDAEAETVAALATRSPGEDPADPYADVDLATLPDWWREAVETFEAHGLRPYRPPRFADGVLKHEVVDRLQADLDVDVTLACFDADRPDRWQVRIDGEQVATVGHHRSPEGYSVFETDSSDFEALVRDAV